MGSSQSSLSTLLSFVVICGALLYLGWRLHKQDAELDDMRHRIEEFEETLEETDEQLRQVAAAWGDYREKKLLASFYEASSAFVPGEAVSEREERLSNMESEEENDDEDEEYDDDVAAAQTSVGNVASVLTQAMTGAAMACAASNGHKHAKAQPRGGALATLGLMTSALGGLAEAPSAEFRVPVARVVITEQPISQIGTTEGTTIEEVSDDEMDP